MAGKNGNGRQKGNDAKGNGCVKINGNGNGNGGKINGGLVSGLPLGLGKLSPQQLAVITALLSNALIVSSVLVNKDQTIEIVLSGSLRRKNKTDKLVEELSGITVGELLDAISRR
jgi:hypothetical protein